MDEKSILISGAGPSGLMMALCLIKLGTPCRIIDKLDKPTTQSRALGIHARTLEIFDVLGIAEEVIKEGVKVNTIEMYSDRKRLTSMDYSNVDSIYPFIIILPQSKTEDILTKELKKLGIEVERSCELVEVKQNDKEVISKIKHGNTEDDIVSPYLIATDGAHSTIRKILSIPFEGKTSKEQWSLADVSIKAYYQKLQVFQDRHSTMAIFPLGKGKCRLVCNNRANANPEANLDKFIEIAKQVVPWELGVTDPTWISPFSINYRSVCNMRKGRVFLCGDAAHIHSPVGGQGMNTGLQDAYNLAWKLNLSLKDDRTEKLLNSFNKERKQVAHEVLKETELATKMATLSNPLLRKLFNAIFRQVSKTQTFQNAWVDKVSECAIQYKDESMSEDYIKPNRANKIIAIGRRMPDAVFYTTKNKPYHLLHLQRALCIGIYFIIFDKHKVKELTAIIETLCNKHSNIFQIVVLGNRHAIKHVPSSSKYSKLIDDESQLTLRFGLHKDAMLVIRPDGYLSFRSYEFDSRKLMPYLEKIIPIGSLT